MTRKAVHTSMKFSGRQKKESGTLEVIELDTDFVKMSWEMIIKEHLSAADALHLVTALNKKVTGFLAAVRTESL